MRNCALYPLIAVLLLVGPQSLWGESYQILDRDENLTEISEEEFFQRLDHLDVLDRAFHTHRPHPPEMTPSRREPPLNIDPFYVLLKSGTHLYAEGSAGEEKAYQLNRDLFTRAILTDYGSHQAWLVDNNNRRRYWVYVSDIIDVNPELTLTPQVATSEFFPPPTSYHTDDKSLQLRHELSFGILSSTATPLRETFNPETSEASGSGVNYTLSALWDFPLQFGWSFVYEQMKNEELSWTSIATGPKISYQAWSGTRHSFEISGELLQGAIMSGTYALEEGFEGDFLRFGLEGRLIRSYSWGEIFVSGKWLRERMSIDRQAFDTFSSPDVGRTNTGVMGVIGLSFETGFKL